MPNNYKKSDRFRSFIVIILTLFMGATGSRAANHIISFGGPVGLNYSPEQLTVAIGDSITWQGSFSSHPLSSTSVPQGAASFQKGSGNTFIYQVLVSGIYAYECDIHSGSGMTGTFNATVSDLSENNLPVQPAAYQLAQNYPNPFNAQTRIQFELPVSQNVSLKVYDITGAVVATLVEDMLPAGRFSVSFNAADLASGIYFYRLSGDKFTITKRMILAK